MSSRIVVSVYAGIVLGLSFAPMSHAARTVTPNERGLLYALPAQCAGNYNCTDWTGIGAYLGQFSYQTHFNAMLPESLKLVHGRFQHFADIDNWTEALFPFTQLVQYNNSEVAAGRPSLFATATYQGVKRPLLWTWYGLQGIYASSPAYPVNLNDERFVQFWVNQYIRPWMSKISKPNVVVLLDNCTFYHHLYGVRDNAGTFVSGLTWDSPYPRNQAEFLTSINNFFLRVRQIDPSIRMICNTDAASSQSEFLASYQNLDGISVENMEYYYQSGADWFRSQFYNQYLNVSWVANSGKIGVIAFNYTPLDTVELRRRYMHYLMVRGDNFFWAPQVNASTEVPPIYYESMKNALGLPTAPTVATQEPGRPRGYNLYSRQTSGGIAYLNWTGVTKTIALPAGRQYKNAAGQPITHITIPDMSGDYALFASSSTTTNQPPVVSLTAPANGATVSSTFTISATASDPDGSIARVEFWQGTNKLGERYAAPYTWTVVGAALGTYTGQWALTAKAVDNSGAVTTSAPVGFTVGGSTTNQPPSVSLTSPTNGATVPSTFTITAAASDSDGSVARVEFWQGPNKLGERYAAPYTWTVYGAPAGNYSGQWALTAKAVDNNGAVTTSAPVAFSVGTSTTNQPPVVSLTSPFNGAYVSSTFTITATASDSDGSIARVEFWQGPNKLGERYAAPYTWTVYGAPAGTYSGQWALTAKAVDNRGAITTSAPVGFTVR